MEVEGHLDLGVQEGEAEVIDSQSKSDGHEDASASRATTSSSNAPVQAEEHPPHPKETTALRHHSPMMGA